MRKSRYIYIYIPNYPNKYIYKFVFVCYSDPHRLRQYLRYLAHLLKTSSCFGRIEFTFSTRTWRRISTVVFYTNFPSTKLDVIPCNACAPIERESKISHANASHVRSCPSTASEWPAQPIRNECTETPRPSTNQAIYQPRPPQRKTPTAKHYTTSHTRRRSHTQKIEFVRS